MVDRLTNQITHDEMEAILYPRRFMSKEEVLLYTSGDRVTCLICDKNYMNLAKHINNAHACDPKKYRDILNIPRTMNLMCKEFVDKISDNSKHRFDNILTQEQKDFLLKEIHNPEGNAGEVVSTISIEGKNRGAKFKGKNKGKIHGRTWRECHGCGVEMQISTQRVRRVTKCPRCLDKSRREAIKNYQKSNKEKISKYQKEWYRAKKEKTSEYSAESEK